jgi:hypothetical protein
MLRFALSSARPLVLGDLLVDLLSVSSTGYLGSDRYSRPDFTFFCSRSNISLRVTAWRASDVLGRITNCRFLVLGASFAMIPHEHLRGS